VASIANARTHPLRSVEDFGVALNALQVVSLEVRREQSLLVINAAEQAGFIGNVGLSGPNFLHGEGASSGGVRDEVVLDRRAVDQGGLVLLDFFSILLISVSVDHKIQVLPVSRVREVFHPPELRQLPLLRLN